MENLHGREPVLEERVVVGLQADGGREIGRRWRADREHGFCVVGVRGGRMGEECRDPLAMRGVPELRKDVWSEEGDGFGLTLQQQRIKGK